jgi:DNA-binding transcriptional MerR regulator
MTAVTSKTSSPTTGSQASASASDRRNDFRIGEAAKMAGTTTRTIRYYEEIGLLPPAAGRVEGKHRLYAESDVERLREVLRLKSLLGLTLDELKEVIEAEEARAELRVRFKREDDPARKREILDESLGYINRQLELVHRRRAEMDQLEHELTAKRRRVKARLRNLAD